MRMGDQMEHQGRMLGLHCKHCGKKTLGEVHRLAKLMMLLLALALIFLGVNVKWICTKVV